MIVKNPMNCVVGCNKCAEFCTTGALTFPEIKELVETLRELRKEYKKS
jgi:NAD-dependent dihydropyrimidine dehydrogenase PreA subunit